MSFRVSWKSSSSCLSCLAIVALRGCESVLNARAREQVPLHCALGGENSPARLILAVVRRRSIQFYTDRRCAPARGTGVGWHDNRSAAWARLLVSPDFAPCRFLS